MTFPNDWCNVTAPTLRLSEVNPDLRICCCLWLKIELCRSYQISEHVCNLFPPMTIEYLNLTS